MVTSPASIRCPSVTCRHGVPWRVAFSPAWLGRTQGWSLATDEANERRIRLGAEESDEAITDLAIDEIGLPERIDEMIGHLCLGEESERADGIAIGITDPDHSEQLLLDRDRGMAVVDPPFIPVGQGDPFDPGDGGIGEDLGRPLAVIEMRTERFRLYEQARRPEEEEGVVDRVVGWSAAILELDVLEVLDVPAERPKDRHDECGFGVLLADPLALVLGDPVANGREGVVEFAPCRR
jgi:hypothetical protein